MNFTFLLFLFLTSATLPFDKADNSSFDAIDQQFIQMFGNEMLSSFTTEAGVPLVGLPLKERVASLVIDHWDELTEEQLVFLFELALTLDHPQLLKILYEEKGGWRNMDKLILNNGTQKLKFYFFYDVLLPSAYAYYQTPRRSHIENELEWKTAVGFYDPFENITIPGPLFSHFDKNYSLKTRLYARRQNFEGLLPDIADYVAGEYQKERIVFFHGQHAIWMFLERIYRKIFEIAFRKKFPKDFIALRFKLHSSLVEKDLEHIKAQWQPYREGPYRDSLLFVNLHFDAGDAGGNTLTYVTENLDQKTSNLNDNDFSFVSAFLSDIFKECGLETTYQKLSKLYPNIFIELKKTYYKAIAEQGYYGRLLVISMPQELAQKLSYLTDWDGGKKLGRICTKNKESFDITRTSDPTLLARHYDTMPERNEFVLMLTEELINPDAAMQAGVKIVGFDPVFYWQTEKAMKWEHKLDEVITLIETMQG